MTRLLAHAIGRAGTAVGAGGLRGQPLAAVAADGLALWATAWSAPVSLTRADAFAHHALVDALCAGGPCLPVRFGTWLVDAAAARRALASARADLEARLERVGDRREIAVTLLWREAPSSEGRGHDVAPSGRAYLERRRAAAVASFGRRATADALAARLEAELAGDQADVRHETCPSDEVALSLSLLARRGEADALKARATRAVAGLPDVRGVVSGPWPPYSFAGELPGGS